MIRLKNFQKYVSFTKEVDLLLLFSIFDNIIKNRYLVC